MEADVPGLDNLEFLVRGHIDVETLAQAQSIAEGWDVPVDSVLLALGWVSVADYVNRLAEQLHVKSVFQCGSLVQRNDAAGHTCQVDATASVPSEVAKVVAARQRQGLQVELTSYLRPEFVRDPNRLKRARASTHRLQRAAPLYSAAGRLPLWLIAFIAGFIGLFAGAAIINPMRAYFLAACVAAIPFAFIICLRLFALVTHITRPRPLLVHKLLPMLMSDLPVYTVLVPLYDEADILPDLVNALPRLDYPAAKLDVILVLEDRDVATRRAADGAGLPGFIRVVAVPDLGPRTKPKALNYALHFARGEFITVFDAEDIPEPQQLRRALSVFAHHPEIDCLQARLNIYNRHESWLAHGIMAQTPQAELSYDFMAFCFAIVLCASWPID